MDDGLTEKVIGAAIEVHRLLGCGLPESIDEEALAYEFSLRGIPFGRQAAVAVRYKERIIKGQRIDLLVSGELIVELKSVTSLPDLVTAQVLSYLEATALKRAVVVNFGTRLLKDGLKRIPL